MSTAPTKILVVEDDPDISKAMAIYAKAKGYEVFVAGNGLHAVDVATKERPQVILLDISLPGMDGRDVFVSLQKAGITQGAVVIFVTARDGQSDRLLGLELGAAEYETKPVHFGLLFKKIAWLLEKKQAESQ
ncbi:MAG: response regulator [Deltaproteobacteria bacterium]|nr:response regulator [Deltaproteobacteria bacterium]